MIKTGRNFTPGLIDSVPIRTRDKQSGKTYVRIGSCNEDLLYELSGNAGVIFDEELVDGDIVVTIGSGKHTFFIDVNQSAKNSKVAVPKNPKEFAIKRLVWIDYPFPRPAELSFTLASYEKHKDTFLFEAGSFVVVSRTEEWYGVKDDDVVFDITNQTGDIGIAYSVLYDRTKRENEARIWRDSKSSAFMDARQVILADSFYAAPVQTILSFMPDYRKGKPDAETMTFLRWRAAIGLEKVPERGGPATPTLYFYFAMLAALYGPHINTLPKYTGAGPGKVVLIDHWLPLFDAMIDEWREDRYIEHTVHTFYRYVKSSPFNIAHLKSITRGLLLAGLVEDEAAAITALRNELYRQWKEEGSQFVKPSMTDYKIAVREMLLTMARFKVV